MRLAFLLVGFTAQSAPTPEWRGLWVDGFHAGYKSRSEITKLISDARRGHFNALFVEVRKRGDAYYDSLFEPRATDIEAGLDPLAELIRQGHAQTPRIEIHAWIVAYPFWASQTSNPSQPDHPYNLHPDWLMYNDVGESWTGSNYQLDPGHPGVQAHLFNVAMDIISRYDVDGFHWDYIRYPGTQWGYNPVALERFNRRYNRSGQPSRTDSVWMQWRRDQVTAVVRRVYLSAIALKPQVKLSAATITWAPGPANAAEWLSTAAYSSVLQDWRGWMAEGILDLNLPMAYFNQDSHPDAWARWSTFAKDNKYRRQLALGTGLWINPVANTLLQFRSTRVPTATGNPAEGMCGFSYAAPASDASLTTFLEALTTPTTYDPQPVPVFDDYPETPDMPWKTEPDRGHLLGYAVEMPGELPVDGANVLLLGPVNKLLRSDAHGCFGLPDLPPGEYRLSATAGTLASAEVTFTTQAGVVSLQNLQLASDPAEVFVRAVTTAPGPTEAFINWETAAPAECHIEFGPAGEALDRQSFVTTPAATAHEVLLTALLPNTTYDYRVVAETTDARYESSLRTFHTAGEIIIDNPVASFSGSWLAGTSAPDRYGEDYRYAGVTDGSATAGAAFIPTIETPGYYDVSEWHTQGANRAENAPFEIVHAAGISRVTVNQTVNGGAWNLLASRRAITPGTGEVRLNNATGGTSGVVIADAVRWVYADDPPPASGNPPPIWWSWHHFGGPTSGNADIDFDGYNNAQEYLAGTNPRQADSHLRFWTEITGPGEVLLRFWPQHPGRRYSLLATDDPGSSAWTPVTEAVGPADAYGVGAFAVPQAGVPSARFYRLEVRLPE
ncbi:MAG: family 10 glycosylhydrolase [Verrucomicrobiales bacterium]|nr:family 10 glycosylhydrolase [Verrucomicrobiales bacterium]